jgi:antitoxin HicB
MTNRSSNTIDYYLKLPYTVELRETPGAGWFARIAELPGCMSQGDSGEEALSMIQEAKELWLEVALDEGKPIPEPRGASEYSGKFVLRLPPSLHRNLAEEANRENVSLNQYIHHALAHAVGGQSTVATVQSSGDTIPVVWPGLDRLTRDALAGAGLVMKANELDERLFGGWLSSFLKEIEREIAAGDQKAALETLAFLLVVLRPSARGSLVLESIVHMLELLRQTVKAAFGVQEGIIQEIVMQG